MLQGDGDNICCRDFPGADTALDSQGSGYAAWPMAMQVHCARIPAKAIFSAERIRPATVNRLLPLGINARKGTLDSRFGDCKKETSQPFSSLCRSI